MTIIDRAAKSKSIEGTEFGSWICRERWTRPQQRSLRMVIDDVDGNGVAFCAGVTGAMMRFDELRRCESTVEAGPVPAMIVGSAMAPGGHRFAATDRSKRIGTESTSQ